MISIGSWIESTVKSAVKDAPVPGFTLPEAGSGTPNASGATPGSAGPLVPTKALSSTGGPGLLAQSRLPGIPESVNGSTAYGLNLSVTPQADYADGRISLDDFNALKSKGMGLPALDYLLSSPAESRREVDGKVYSFGKSPSGGAEPTVRLRVSETGDTRTPLRMEIEVNENGIKLTNRTPGQPERVNDPRDFAEFNRLAGAARERPSLY